MTNYNPISNSANITAQGRGPAFQPVQSRAVSYPARPTLNPIPGQGGGAMGAPSDMAGTPGGPPGSVAPGGLPGQAQGGMPNAQGAFAMDPTLDDKLKMQGPGAEMDGGPNTAQQATLGLGMGAFAMGNNAGLGQTGQPTGPQQTSAVMGGGVSGFGNRGARMGNGIIGGAGFAGMGRR